jgi:superfamily II DNA/RNA helicase
LAEVKQEKQLSRRPSIVVATPGRLWALIQGGDAYLSEGLKRLRFIVLDEADRLMESGHFKDLALVLGLLPAPRKVHIDGRGCAHLLDIEEEEEEAEAEAEAAGDGECAAAPRAPTYLRPVRQALLFSATFVVRNPLSGRASETPQPGGSSNGLAGDDGELQRQRGGGIGVGGLGGARGRGL